MRRREFIVALAGAAVVRPVRARAQQSGPLLVGFLHSESAEAAASQAAAFLRGLKEAGYTDGQNVTIEYRWADAQLDRLPMLAADLKSRRVAVIAAGGGTRSAAAAKAVSTDIPIVFAVNVDPLRLGLVNSLNRPGGNITGVTAFTNELGPKWFGLLRELVPDAQSFGLLLNPQTPIAESLRDAIESAAKGSSQRIVVANATSEAEIASSFARLAEERVGAVVLQPDNFFAIHRDRLIGLAAQHGIPALYNRREWAAAGGLMSYGNDTREQYRQLGIYAGRILAGAWPGDLPVLQSSRFELVINLKTARSLKFEVPAKLLALADEVIEW